MEFLNGVSLLPFAWAKAISQQPTEGNRPSLFNQLIQLPTYDVSHLRVATQDRAQLVPGFHRLPQVCTF